jgi:hypothetical protein
MLCIIAALVPSNHPSTELVLMCFVPYYRCDVPISVTLVVPERPESMVSEIEAAAASFHQESLRSLIVAENEFNKKMRALVQV